MFIKHLGWVGPTLVAIKRILGGHMGNTTLMGQQNSDVTDMLGCAWESLGTWAVSRFQH